MNGDTVQLLNLLSEALNQQSAVIGKTNATFWLEEIGRLLKEIEVHKIQVERYANLRKTRTKTSNETMEFAKLKDDIRESKILRECYKLINIISETLRGEEVFYEVTLTTQDNGKKTMTTYRLTLEDFLNYATATSGTRITLRHTRSLISQMEAKNVENIQWGTDRIKAYNNFKRNVQRSIANKGKKINQGQYLEAFLRWEENQPGMTTGQAMVETLSNTTGFWGGGDINNRQIKANRASVTNLKSLEIQLKKIQQLLLRFQSITNYEPVYQAQLLQGSGILESTLEAEQEKATEQLMQDFQAYFNINIF